MSSYDTAEAIVKAAINDVNMMRGKGDQVSMTPETVLLGSGSPLDSLALVNFLVAVETHAEDVAGLDLILAADVGSPKAMQDLATIGSLIKALESEIAGG